MHKPQKIAAILIATSMFYADGFAAAQQAPASPKWEYAKMSVGSYHGSSDVLFSFYSLQKRIDSKSWDDLCKQLGMPPGPQVDFMVLALSAVGRDGWELVYHSKDTDDIGTTENWVFKRPTR